MLPAFALFQRPTALEGLLAAYAGQGVEHHAELGKLWIFPGLDSLKGAVVQSGTADKRRLGHLKLGDQGTVP